MILTDAHIAAVQRVLARYGLTALAVPLDVAIPGSYWGESEAGLIRRTLYCRPDTPLHSVLHEASHFICMDESRRAQLDCDAGGDYDEENAVCYLQIVLADEFVNFGRERMCANMDAWGYTFRLGGAKAWFEHDAQDARSWLVGRGVIDHVGRMTWRKRSG